jgi:hypothetical protein
MKTLSKAIKQTHETTQVGVALFAMWMSCAILLIVD